MEPELPGDITGRELAGEIRSQLRPLNKENADVVAKQLVATGRLIDSDPEQAYEFAKAAVNRAGRIGVVRESLGLVAYELDKYDEAIRELRTHRRITGSDDNLALILDSERGRGLPDKALELFSEIDREKLTDAGWIECVIVAAGAYSDKGQAQRARALVEDQGFTGHKPSATVRLLSAYSDLLAISGEQELAAKYEELARRTAKANSVTFGDEEIDPNAGIEIVTIEEEDLEEDSDDETVDVPETGAENAAEAAHPEDEPESEPDDAEATSAAESTAAESTGPAPAAAQPAANAAETVADVAPAISEPAKNDATESPAGSASFEQEVEDEVDDILRDAGIDLDD